MALPRPNSNADPNQDPNSNVNSNVNPNRGSKSKPKKKPNTNVDPNRNSNYGSNVNPNQSGNVNLNSSSNYNRDRNQNQNQNSNPNFNSNQNSNYNQHPNNNYGPGQNQNQNSNDNYGPGRPGQNQNQNNYYGPGQNQNQNNNHGNRNGNGELLHRMSNGLLGHTPSQPNVDRFVCRRLYNSDWNISNLYDTQIVQDNWYNSNVYPTIATLRPNYLEVLFNPEFISYKTKFAIYVLFYTYNQRSNLSSINSNNQHPGSSNMQHLLYSKWKSLNKTLYSNYFRRDDVENSFWYYKSSSMFNNVFKNFAEFWQFLRNEANICGISLVYPRSNIDVYINYNAPVGQSQTISKHQAAVNRMNNWIVRETLVLCANVAGSALWCANQATSQLDHEVYKRLLVNKAYWADKAAASKHQSKNKLKLFTKLYVYSKIVIDPVSDSERNILYHLQCRRYNSLSAENSVLFNAALNGDSDSDSDSDNEKKNDSNIDDKKNDISNIITNPVTKDDTIRKLQKEIRSLNMKIDNIKSIHEYDTLALKNKIGFLKFHEKKWKKRNDKLNLKKKEYKEKWTNAWSKINVLEKQNSLLQIQINYFKLKSAELTNAQKLLVQAQNALHKDQIRFKYQQKMHKKLQKKHGIDSDVSDSDNDVQVTLDTLIQHNQSAAMPLDIENMLQPLASPNKIPLLQSSPISQLSSNDRPLNHNDPQDNNGNDLQDNNGNGPQVNNLSQLVDEVMPTLNINNDTESDNYSDISEEFVPVKGKHKNTPMGPKDIKLDAEFMNDLQDGSKQSSDAQKSNSNNKSSKPSYDDQKSNSNNKSNAAPFSLNNLEPKHWHKPIVRMGKAERLVQRNTLLETQAVLVEDTTWNGPEATLYVAEILNGYSNFPMKKPDNVDANAIPMGWLVYSYNKLKSGKICWYHKKSNKKCVPFCEKIVSCDANIIGNLIDGLRRRKTYKSRKFSLGSNSSNNK